MTGFENKRSKILQCVAALYTARFGDAGMKLSSDQWRANKAEEQHLLMEYAEILPYLSVSRCPICQQVVELPVDVAGLDGPWWWRLCPVELPPAVTCGHFQVFLGALSLRGKVPMEVTRTIMPGPGKPFVVDRLLNIDGVIAVLSAIRINPGYTGCLISYFSQEPLAQGDLHQEWRQETFGLKNADGELVASEQKLDPWNFDLKGWLNQKKLWFIKPGDNSLLLLEDMPSAYDVKEGVELHQYITNGQVSYMEAPQGGETGIYDTAD